MRHIIRLFLTLLFISNIFYLHAADKEIKTLSIGSKAPDFKLEGTDGKMYTLDSFKEAEILVIIFTANHCPTAQAYEERINQLVKDFRSKGVQFVAVSSNNPDALRLGEQSYTDLGDTMEDMKIRATDMNYNFPYLYDGTEQKMANAYGPMTTPHVFIFDEKRKLRFAGRIDDNENSDKVTQQDTRNAIEALLNNEAVPVKETKTFGCSIKWKSKIESPEKRRQRWDREDISLELIDLSGLAKLLKNESRNLRMINFWTTWCGGCVAEFPDLVDINRIYRNREFEMVTVSLDPPNKKEKVLNFLKKHYASTRNYIVDSEDTYKIIETVDKDWPGSLPYTLIIKPGGDILFKKLGEIEVLETRKVIVEYLGRYFHSVPQK